jgi:hypothetical protein
VNRGSLKLALEQVAFLADYIYVSYSGTLAQWKSFFARRDTLPPVLAKVTLERDAAGGARFRSPRLDFDVPAGAFKITDESSAQVQMTFGESAGKATWEIGAVYITRDDDSKPTYVGAVRQPKPGKDAGKDAADRWDHMLTAKEEFADERGYDSEYKKTWRRTAVNETSRGVTGVDPASAVLYEIISVVGNTKLPREVDDIHERLMENVRVKEH